jgi:quinol monooxygenase YgiN
MAIVVIAGAKGATAEQFEALQRKFNESTNPPSGQKLLLAGPVEGGWRVISVWESQEAYDAFRRDQLAPAIQQMGITEDQPQIAPLHSIMIAPQQH